VLINNLSALGIFFQNLFDSKSQWHPSPKTFWVLIGHPSNMKRDEESWAFQENTQNTTATTSESEQQLRPETNHPRFSGKTDTNVLWTDL
jgi:hypothetical protein